KLNRRSSESRALSEDIDKFIFCFSGRPSLCSSTYIEIELKKKVSHNELTEAAPYRVFEKVTLVDVRKNYRLFT
ncbi:MAG: hypothetical protein D3917_17225, partial [Candidatus Electrothrix sp. AX5]|nr:hypothetical protein [Candidatus Electrothrix sp. AX5]